jgi:hypothetical protein
MGNEIASNNTSNTSIAKPYEVPRTGLEYLNFLHKKPEIFDKFAKLGELTYVFYIRGENGKDLQIPQKHLWQFVKECKNQEYKNNLFAFFNSANLGRLSRLPQGYIHRIDLGAAAKREDPIKPIEDSCKKLEDSFKVNSSSKTDKTDKEIIAAGVPLQMKTAWDKNGPRATENLGQTSYISDNTVCSYTLQGITNLVKEIGYLSKEKANEMIEAFKG